MDNEKNFGTRLAVLEVKVEHHENKFDEVNNSLDKLNSEMQILVTAVTKLTTTLDKATIAIEKVSDIANTSNTKWVQFSSYTAGATKVITVVVFLLGCVWALFTYVNK